MAAMARAATTSDAFNAIAEPQRREILVLLRGGESPVTELARNLGMSQPQASKHLRVLREVGLVRVRGAGKQRLYDLDARGLRPITSGWAASSGSGARASTGWTSTCRTCNRRGRRDHTMAMTSSGGERDAAASDRSPDREIVISRGHRRPAGAGVRGVHAGPAPVPVVGTGGVHDHDAVLRVSRRRGLGLRDARAGRDRLPGVDHLDRDRPAGANRAGARRVCRRPQRLSSRC